jgi:queuine tRNA-ribosyltransferase
LDALTGRPDDRDEAASSAARTLRWAERTRRSGDPTGATSLFAIVQGGLFEDLRRENAAALAELDFPGYAVGGLSVGESPARTMETAAYGAGLLPDGKPRYMMGMGTPQDLIRLCGWGYDLFDCVIPTRNARNGTLFTMTGKLSIRNARHASSADPIEDDCDCYACGRFSRGYLHHLAKRGEMLAAVLCSIHNVHFYQRLMRRIRRALTDGDYARFADDAVAGLAHESEV